MEETIEKKPIALNFAPTWKRIVAYLIDMILLSLLFYIIFSIAMEPQIKMLTPAKIKWNTIFQTQDASLSDMFKQATHYYEQLPIKVQAFLFLYFQYMSTIQWLMLLLTASYFTLFWAAGGQTIGQKIFKIIVIDIHARPVTFLQSFFRYIGLAVSQWALYIPLLFLMNKMYKQRLHDFFSGTVVVEIPKEPESESKIADYERPDEL